MKYDLSNNTELMIFNEQSKWLSSNKKLVELKEIKQVRSNPQSRARWLYLEMCSTILNDRGETYNPPNTKLEVKWNKDLLYEIYWLNMRKHMFPGKTKQLNTKEFSDLVEMVLMLFAKVFEISISFPNWQDKTLKE